MTIFWAGDFCGNFLGALLNWIIFMGYIFKLSAPACVL